MCLGCSQGNSVVQTRDSDVVAIDSGCTFSPYQW
nr:MAG TPA: hypothetical protein [Caudoviricetes sp.]